MRKLLDFLNNMDARAQRTVWVSLALLVGVVALLVLGKTGVLGFSEDLEPWLESLRESPWALPVTIGVFIVSSFIAFPQFMLGGICVLAFGPWLGFAYTIVGTAVASTLHFYMGRFGGAKLVQRYGGNTVSRLSRFIGRNDFIASTIVRSVPVAPAIVVNMAFGASQAKFWRFIAGCIIGSVPKTLIPALLGQSVLSAMSGGIGIAIAAIVVVIGIWVTVAVFARRAVHDEETPDDPDKTGDKGGPEA